VATLIGIIYQTVQSSITQSNDIVSGASTESVNTFETRVLKSYGKYDCRILLSVREGEGFYIN
jgi:hypothetical protein